MPSKRPPVPICPGRPARPNPARLGLLPLAGPAPSARRLLALLVLLAASAAPRRALGLLGLTALLAAAWRIQEANLRDSSGNPFVDDVGNPYPGSLEDVPIWRGIDTTEVLSGVSNLDRNLTINGTTVAPTFWYKGEDASGTTWTPEVGGADGLLTEAGSGASPSYAQGTPLLGTDAGVKYNAAKYHLAPAGGAFGDIGTEDFVVEMVFRHGSVVNETYLDKRTGSVLYTIYNPAGASIRLYLNDGAGHTASISSSTLTVGAWYHAIWFVDRSGSAQLYYNLSAAGGAADVSSVGTLTNNGRMSAGGTNTGGGLLNTVVSHMAMWKRSAWLDTHLQATLVGQRFRALTGFRPQASNVGVDTAPLSYTRATNATLEKYNATTGKTEFYTVGSGWLRQERWLSGGAVVSGYRSELASTNKITYSSVTEATWTKADAGDTTTAVDGPWGAGASEGWVSDATDGNHSRLLACTTTAAAHVFWARVKAGAAPFIALYDPISNVGRYFNSSTGALGAAMGGAPTTSYALVDEDASGWMILAMVWTATAAARNLTIYPCDADGDPTVTGDGATAELLFSHAQCELGTVDSSPIKTSGAIATRNKDELRSSTSHAGTSGAVIMDVVGRSQTAIPANSYLIDMNDTGSTNRTVILVASTGVRMYHGVSTDGVVQGTAGQALDGTVRRIGHRWKSGVMEAWVGGAYVGQDVAFTLPAAMTQIGIGMATGGSNYQPASPTLIRRVCVYDKYPASMARLTTL